MKEPELQALWDEVFSAADELELFEPRLKGLHEQLTALASDQVLPESWIVQAKPSLKGDAIVELAFKLNEIAGVYYSNRIFTKAKSACQCALALYEAALGVDHPDTKLIAGNLERLQESLSKFKLKRFDKRKKK